MPLHGWDGAQGSESDGTGRRRPLLAPASQHPDLTVRQRSRSRQRDEDEPAESHQEMPDEAMPEAEARPNVIEHERIGQIKQLVENELMKALPSEALQHVKKSALDLSTKIDSLQKVNSRLSKAKDDLELLQNYRIPNGTRPVPMPYDSPLLDSLRPASTWWTFAVDDTVSIREAKKRIHCQYLSAMKTLDVQVAKAQRKNLRDYAKKSAFLDRCKAARRTQKSLWDHLDLDLEDDVPQTVQGLTDTAFDARIESVYIKTVDQAAIAQKKAQLESLQQKGKERQIQELLKSKPEDLLNAVIDERISDRLKPRRRNQRGPAVDIAGIFTESQGLKPAERVHCEPHVSDTFQNAGGASSTSSKPNRQKTSLQQPSAPKGAHQSKGKGAAGKSAAKGKDKGKGGKPSGQKGKGTGDGGVFPYAEGARAKKGKGKGDESGVTRKDHKGAVGKAKGRGRGRN